MFSELIFNGKISNLTIGKIISDLKLKNITEGQGDIPSLYNFKFKDEDFQITTLKGKIIGILYDFEYEKNRMFNLKIKNKTFEIGYNSNFKEFTAFVKQNKIKHKIFHSESNDYAEVQIEKSGICLRFINTNLSNLCKIWNFDWKLYEILSAEIKLEESNRN